MVAFVFLPGRASVPYQGTVSDSGRGGELVHPARHRHAGRGDCVRARRRGAAAVPTRTRLLVEHAYGRRTDWYRAEGLLHDRGDVGRATTRRPRTVRWLVIVGLLLAVVLGGLYGFNRFREQAIATYFASNKPPPAQISAAEVKTEAVPRFATGIGSVTAVHQVTINPEVGGRVTKIFFEPGATVKAGDPLVQINDAPDRGDLASYEAQARCAANHIGAREPARPAPVRGAGNRRPEAEPARPGAGDDHQDRGADRAKADPRAVLRPARHAPGRGRAIPHPGRPDRHPDRSVDALRQFHPAVADALRRSRSGSGSTSPPTRSPAALSPPRSRRSSRRSAPIRAR